MHSYILYCVFILLLWEKQQNIITYTYLGAIINETGG
jgi:hypothetical protein